MFSFIDDLLNRITMYRLVLYYLLLLLAVAVAFSYFGILPYNPVALVFSGFLITCVAILANDIFARVFRAHANVESIYITALILVLIITPPKLQPIEWSTVGFLVWAAVWAMASKYMFAIGKKHVFNPAAFAVALTTFTIGSSASWWAAGNLPLLPFVFAGGLLIVRKLQRSDLVIAFFTAAAVSVVATTFARGNPWSSLVTTALHSPLFFFAFVMLTEPLTTPPTRPLRVAYGAFVGLLFAPAVHFGSIYSTPELALLLGNLFSYLVSPKWKEVLRLKEKVATGSDLCDFVFAADRKLNFRPGQYLEWTLSHPHSDGRGNRRYFTIASSPTEPELRMGVKFHSPPSSFKRALHGMAPGDTIVATQLAGDFTLPRNPNRKLVFIAGGIGVTPFRSMVKFLMDRGERRAITMFYAARTVSEFAYADLFEEARQKIGLKVVYVLTDERAVPRDWQGHVGRMTPAMILAEVPDYKERMFYMSGPRSMVVTFTHTLVDMKVGKRNIKTDFFPGFA